MCTVYTGVYTAYTYTLYTLLYTVYTPLSYTVYNAYLYAKGYGIKEHLIGWVKGQSNIKTEEEFLDMVECTLEFEDYINEYKEKWF